MKLIELTQNRFAKVSDIDYKSLKDFNWCASRRKYGVWYAIRTHEDGTRIYMHREILRFPRGLVDHKDKDGLNNCRRNLRVATQVQNQANARKHSHSKNKYKGICRSGLFGYSAKITVNKHKLYLGTFKSQEEAAKAYDAAAKKHFGKFARTNF